jgi:hypothetical protein
VETPVDGSAEVELSMSAASAFHKLLLFGLISQSGNGGEWDNHSPIVTLQSIRSAILRVHNMVKSLEVVYVQATNTKSADDPKRYDRIHFLAKDRLRLRETRHSTTRFPESLDLNHMTQFLTHDSFDYFVHNSRFYERSRSGFKSPTTWKLKDEGYLNMCGWWPREDDPSAEADLKIAIHLRFVMDNPHYTLLADTAAVDGHPCYVVESPGADRLWLDPALAYAIRKREIYDGTGRVRHRTMVKTFQQCDVIGKANERASIWMPTRISNDYEPDDANVASDGVIKLRNADIVVERISVNGVDDLSFNFVPPPGTLVYDRDSDSSHQIPGGRDLLDENIGIEQSLQRIERKTAPRSEFEVHSLAVGVGALVLSILYYVVLSRSK